MYEPYNYATTYARSSARPADTRQATNAAQLPLLTGPTNLICLCPTHHRALHAGDFRIQGNPEERTVRFFDRRGRPIEPPGTGPPIPVQVDEPSPFQPPDGERLSSLWFAWN